MYHTRRRNRSIDYDSIVHRSFFFEHFNDSSDFSFFLSDGNIDTVDIFSFLIEDSISGDSSFSGLSISDDKFSLSSTNRYHRINGFDSGF